VQISPIGHQQEIKIIIEEKKKNDKIEGQKKAQNNWNSKKNKIEPTLNLPENDFKLVQLAFFVEYKKSILVDKNVEDAKQQKTNKDAEEYNSLIKLLDDKKDKESGNYPGCDDNNTAAIDGDHNNQGKKLEKWIEIIIENYEEKKKETENHVEKIQGLRKDYKSKLEEQKKEAEIRIKEEIMKAIGKSIKRVTYESEQNVNRIMTEETINHATAADIGVTPFDEEAMKKCITEGVNKAMEPFFNKHEKPGNEVKALIALNNFAEGKEKNKENVEIAIRNVSNDTEKTKEIKELSKNVYGLRDESSRYMMIAIISATVSFFLLAWIIVIYCSKKSNEIDDTGKSDNKKLDAASNSEAEIVDKKQKKKSKKKMKKTKATNEKEKRAIKKEATTINATELALRRLALEEFDNDLDHLFKLVDVDGNGRITKEEFIKLFPTQTAAWTEILDINDNGTIEIRELKKLYHETGIDVLQGDIKEIERMQNDDLKVWPSKEHPYKKGDTVYVAYDSTEDPALATIINMDNLHNIRLKFDGHGEHDGFRIDDLIPATKENQYKEGDTVMVEYDEKLPPTEAIIINMKDVNNITLDFGEHGEHKGFRIDELMPAYNAASVHVIEVKEEKSVSDN